MIRNLQGACYDDFVALNAHEGSGGDVTNIQIDGLFAGLRLHPNDRAANILWKI